LIVSHSVHPRLRNVLEKSYRESQIHNLY